VHLVLLHGEAEDVNWKDAIAWAEKAGGVLPSRIDHLVLFKNLRDQFKKDGWYWSSEEHAEYSDYAWVQYFGYGGYQDYGRKDTTTELARSARSQFSNSPI
jgi:hypothetical protein